MRKTSKYNRIDDLFNGGTAIGEGVKVLARFDDIRKLVYSDFLITLAEGKVISGLSNHNFGNYILN